MTASMDVQRLTALLTRERDWGHVRHFEEIGSTNTEAARHPLLWSPVFAEHQSAGRGRLDRSWQDLPGAGIAVSVLVPHVPNPGWLPLVAGLAVRDALAGEGVDADLKWPNDVLLPADEDRKVCGILCRSLPDAGVVVGIGINVAQRRSDLPVDTATSLRVVGAMVDRTELAAAVLGRLRHWHEVVSDPRGAAATKAAYEQACSTLGRAVLLHHGDGSREEVDAVGIGVDGELLIRGERGSATVAAGDVQHVRLPNSSATKAH